MKGVENANFDPIRFGREVLHHMDGMSLRDAAKLTGVSSATLQRITKGRAPDIYTYFKLDSWLPKPPCDCARQEHNVAAERAIS